MSTALSPEEIGEALAEAADDGWVAARPPGRVSGPAREWWPGPLAVLYAADEDAAVTWVTDPDGCDLQVTKPDKPAIRFDARKPAPQPPNAESRSTMTADSYVIARDPVDPRALFDAAREAVGNPKLWTLRDGPEYGAVHMYQTRSGQGAAAAVAVHFPAAGGPYPHEDPESPRPDGYAHVGFSTGGNFSTWDEAWDHHAALVRKLGQWLDASGIRWCWVFENDEWIHGHVPASRPGIVALETGEVPNPGRRTPFRDIKIRITGDYGQEGFDAEPEDRDAHPHVCWRPRPMPNGYVRTGDHDPDLIDRKTGLTSYGLEPAVPRELVDEIMRRWGPASQAAPDLGRRTARTAADPGPADVWKPLITSTSEFDPENDAVLLAWMTGEAGGMAGYAEGIAAAYETATNVTGLDPAALATLHDYADAAAAAAEAMAAARQRFTSHYSEVRTFTASGGVLPYNGRWMTGEGS